MFRSDTPIREMVQRLGHETRPHCRAARAHISYQKGSGTRIARDTVIQRERRQAGARQSGTGPDQGAGPDNLPGKRPCRKKS
ncbi:hypothetical protein [Desulfoplanes sp.]